MSWLISLLLASSILTTDSNIPVQKNYLYTNPETTKVIALDETERFEQTYPLSASGRVSVSNINGSITIETWDNNQVKLEAVKTADSKERFAEVEIKIDARADSFTVETDYGNNKRNWNRGSKLIVDYKLMVPKMAVLDEIETVNGSVNITNANNLTKASAVNGQVRALNLRGTADLSTVNGTVAADFDQLQTGSKITLNTVNGQVNLMIPSDVNATVKADTVNGNIVNDFGLPVRKGQYVGRDLYGKIGNGDVPIRLNSVNGGLSIKRKNDGRNQNPVTNLLPQKTEDNDKNWENDTSLNTSRTDKQISQARKDADKAVREAQKEMEKIRPELEKMTEESVRQSAEIIRKTNEFIKSEEFQKRLREAEKRQRDALTRVTEAGFVSGFPAIEKKTDTFPVKGIPKITIEARESNVNVRGWDRAEVQYSVTRISKDRNAKPLDLKAARTDSEVTLKVINPADEDCDCNSPDIVRVEVFVPKKSNLRIVANGEIRLENVSGEISVEGADEAINIRDVDGKLFVANADGRIRVIGFRGEIESKTADGEISLEGDFQKLSAQTIDGTIILTLPEDANASLESTTRAVESEGLAFTLVEEKTAKLIYKIGKGGNNFRVAAADGKILIRSSSGLKTIY